MNTRHQTVFSRLLQQLPWYSSSYELKSISQFTSIFEVSNDYSRKDKGNTLIVDVTLMVHLI